MVGNQQVADPVFLLQIFQQVHNLGADGHIQGGYRFIQHNQLGVQGQPPGNSQALPLSAAELVGVKVGVVGTQAHIPQQLIHSRRDFLPRRRPVNGHRLGYQVPHPHPGVQGTPGVLKDGLH